MASMEDQVKQSVGEKIREQEEAYETAAVARKERVDHGAAFEKLGRAVVLPVLDARRFKYVVLALALAAPA